LITTETRPELIFSQWHNSTGLEYTPYKGEVPGSSPGATTNFKMKFDKILDAWILLPYIVGSYITDILLCWLNNGELKGALGLFLTIFIGTVLLAIETTLAIVVVHFLVTLF
jgi:hypothetical protein